MAFYRELERRGKETPLSDVPTLDQIDRHYLGIIMRIRKLAQPITMQDLSSYCAMFPVQDKARLLDVAAQVNSEERTDGSRST